MGLALLGERLPAGALPRAYAWYMSLDCLGSVVGPVCMGQARDGLSATFEYICPHREPVGFDESGDPRW